MIRYLHSQLWSYCFDNAMMDKLDDMEKYIKENYDAPEYEHVFEINEKTVNNFFDGIVKEMRDKGILG